MTHFEAYILGYIYRLIQDTVEQTSEVSHLNCGICAQQPIANLLKLQKKFLHIQTTQDLDLICLLYTVHRRFQFHVRYDENVILDEHLQWSWLIGYNMLDVEGYQDRLKEMLQETE